MWPLDGRVHALSLWHRVPFSPGDRQFVDGMVNAVGAAIMDKPRARAAGIGVGVDAGNLGSLLLTGAAGPSARCALGSRRGREAGR